MSEQIIIDREAPPWAQRLQTDLNAAFARLDRRLISLRSDTSWQSGDDIIIEDGTSNVYDFSVPEAARHIRVEGIFRPTTAATNLLFRSGPSDGSYHAGASDYSYQYLFGEGATAPAALVNSATVMVTGATGNDTYSHFVLTISRSPTLGRTRFTSVGGGFYAALTPYVVSVSGVGPAGHGSNRFFRFIVGSGVIAELRARVEYRT